ncbi:MAG: VCBS repeat-containing protein [Candidatus Nanoarchaeia archaeon]|jgi:hypothetical protein
MNKTITPIVSVILLVLITIVASVSAYFFINSNVINLESQGNLDNYPGADNSRINLVSITGTKALIRNDGSSPVNEVIVFINGELLNFTLDSPILPGEIFQINFTSQTAGEDLTVKILYGNGKVTQSTSYGEDNNEGNGFTEFDSENPEYYYFQTNDSILNFENEESAKISAYWTDEYLTGGEWYYTLSYLGNYCYSSSPENFSSNAEWTNITFSPSWKDVGSYVNVSFHAEDSSFNSNQTGYEQLIIASDEWRCGSNNNYRTGLYFFGSESAPTGTVSWPAVMARDIVSSASAIDLDGDGNLEIIAGSYSHIYSFYSNGTKMWEYNDGGVSMASKPVVGDLDRDGDYEVVSIAYDDVDSETYLYILNDDGTLNCSSASLQYGAGAAMPSLIDLDGDGELDVVVQAASVLYGIYNNCTTYWSFSTPMVSGSNPAFVDVDGDGTDEIITCSLYLYAFYTNGTQMWASDASSCVTPPAIGDLDGDGNPEIVTGSQNYDVTAFYLNGTIMWTFDEGGHTTYSPSLGDLDNDGKLEVLIGSNDYNIYALYSNGSKMWNFTVGDTPAPSPALGDIDNDGMLDVIFGSRDHKMYSLYWNGSKMWEYDSGYIIYYPAILADTDSDGNLNIIFGNSNKRIYTLENDGTVLD